LLKKPESFAGYGSTVRGRALRDVIPTSNREEEPAFSLSFFANCGSLAAAGMKTNGVFSTGC